MSTEIAAKLLIVDDEPEILDLLQFHLEYKGYQIERAQNGVEAIIKAKNFKPDLILLDVMMPQKDGLQTLKDLRTIPSLKDTAVIFLTALKDEYSEVKGLEIGADDYLSKPIKLESLSIRIYNLLQRKKQQHEEEQLFHRGDLLINKTQFTVFYKGQEIVLARKEFELLALLASQPGRVFLRNEILDKIWGSEVIVGDRTIDVHIRKIRQKSGLDWIVTVKGVGYKFVLQD